MLHQPMKVVDTHSVTFKGLSSVQHHSYSAQRQIHILGDKLDFLQNGHFFLEKNRWINTYYYHYLKNTETFDDTNRKPLEFYVFWLLVCGAISNGSLGIPVIRWFLAIFLKYGEIWQIRPLNLNSHNSAVIWDNFNLLKVSEPKFYAL